MLTIRPSPRGAHGGERRAAAEERAGQVDLERFFPGLRRCLRERRGRQHAGRADESRELPASSTAANRRSTSSTLAHVRRHRRGLAPASRMRPATLSRASWSRAASTTWAPAAAMASAVAAPIPRLAPVTTASRPASQCLDSAIGPRPRHQRRPLAGRAARERRDSAPDRDGVRHGRGIPRARVSAVLRTASAAAWMSSGATRKPVTLVDDHLAERAAFESDDGSPARLRFGRDHAERLVPPCRE